MITVFAPSNIALIKYMGKVSAAKKEGLFPSNSSVSLTLSRLGTYTEISESAFEGACIALSSGDFWQDSLPDFYPVILNEKSREKISKHLERLKKAFGISIPLYLRSGNTFPQGVGIASSASGYAALTKAVWEFAKFLKTPTENVSWQELAKLSSQGSGSSGRSFEGPLVYWNINAEGKSSFEKNPLPSSWGKLKDRVFLISSVEKEVSSSEAHLRVLTSPLFASRLTTVKTRMEALQKALEKSDWKAFCRVTAEDALEMHALFESSQPPFGYRTSETLRIFETFSKAYVADEFLCAVTLDAGPNVHVIYREQDEENFQKVWDSISADFSHLKILEDFVHED